MWVLWKEGETMHFYSTGQWVLLFFLYCFCGWIWESCYVSACKRHWVNRGFLQGPVLPIYGSGAILILFVTLPVEKNLILVFLFGMIAATILEYVTGAVMEKLFKVRYWDYSKHLIQLNGYICLSSSIAWGAFSVLLIRYVHPPVGRIIEKIPEWIVDPLALVLVVAFTVDVVQSTQAALDFREVLERLTEENEDLRRLAKRAEVIATFTEDDLRQFRNRTALDKLLFEIKIEEDLEALHDARIERKMKRKEHFEKAFQKRINIKLDILDEIFNVLESHKEDVPVQSEEAKELNEVMEKVHEYKMRIQEREIKRYRKFMRILHANPSARAKGFEDVMKNLREMEKEDK